MPNKPSIALLMLFILLKTIPATSQIITYSDTTLLQTPNLTMETVKGNHVQIGEKQQTPAVLFLLSKPSSMSTGKKLLKDIRLWIKAISSKYKDKVTSSLIVQPFKTLFPFYQIQKQKLKNESFSIIIDKKGKLLNKLAIGKNGGLSAILIIGDRGMPLPIPATFNESNRKKLIHKIDNFISVTADSASY